MHDKKDIDKLDELHEKEEEEKTTFRSVINKRNLNDFEMDMLFFEEGKVYEESEKDSDE